MHCNACYHSQLIFNHCHCHHHPPVIVNQIVQWQLSRTIHNDKEYDKRDMQVVHCAGIYKNHPQRNIRKGLGWIGFRWVIVLRNFPWGGTEAKPHKVILWVFGIDYSSLHWCQASCTWCCTNSAVRISSKMPTRRSMWGWCKACWKQGTCEQLDWDEIALSWFWSQDLSWDRKMKSKQGILRLIHLALFFSCHSFHYAMPASSIHRTPLVFIGAKSANIEVPNRQFTRIISKTPF